jgi:ABC-type antimicrobial peptide transport system permease subunit
VEPAIYFPMAQDVLPQMTLILGAREENDAVLASVRHGLDVVPGGTPGGVVVTTLDAHLGRTALAPERIATTLVGASAATALALGVLGLYGVMTDAVRQRRREIAVRVALGAQGWRVIRQLLVEGVRLAGAGTVAGMLGSLLVTRWLARITPVAGSLTVWVWLAAPLVLVGAVAIASVLPARRALMVDPLTIMRDN